MTSVETASPSASTTPQQSGGRVLPLIEPGRGILARDLWCDRTRHIRKELNFWLEVAEREQCVFAQSGLRVVLREVERLRQRAEGEEDWSK